MLNATPAAPLIACGRNAGQPRPLNTIILDRLTIAKAAVVTLTRQGFALSREPELGGISPTLYIENCPKCAELGGSTVQWAHDARGPYQVVESRLAGPVRVRWIMRGH